MLPGRGRVSVGSPGAARRHGVGLRPLVCGSSGEPHCRPCLSRVHSRVLLGKYFNTIYVPLYPPFKDIIVLGHIALIEIVVMVLLEVRRVRRCRLRLHSQPERVADRRPPLPLFRRDRAPSGAGAQGRPFRPGRSSMEDRGHIFRISVGGGALGGILLPGRFAGMDRGVDAEPRGRTGDYLVLLRPGPHRFRRASFRTGRGFRSRRFWAGFAATPATRQAASGRGW